MPVHKAPVHSRPFYYKLKTDIFLFEIKLTKQDAWSAYIINTYTSAPLTYTHNTQTTAVGAVLGHFADRSFTDKSFVDERFAEERFADGRFSDERLATERFPDECFADDVLLADVLPTNVLTTYVLLMNLLLTDVLLKDIIGHRQQKIRSSYDKVFHKDILNIAV